jgi:hypothetical protein
MANITRPVLIAANKELEGKVTALEARLSVATEVWRNQRARIAELEALLATRGHIANTPAPAAAPAKAKAEHKVHRFTKRDGSVWERHSWTGNSRAVIRPVMQ